MIVFLSVSYVLQYWRVLKARWGFCLLRIHAMMHRFPRRLLWPDTPQETSLTLNFCWCYSQTSQIIHVSTHACFIMSADSCVQGSVMVHLVLINTYINHKVVQCFASWLSTGDRRYRVVAWKALTCNLLALLWTCKPQLLAPEYGGAEWSMSDHLHSVCSEMVLTLWLNRTACTS